MAMTAGSVDRTTIDATTGVASTATGFAQVIYNWTVAYYAAIPGPEGPVPKAAPTIGSTSAPFSAAGPCTSGNVATANKGRLAQFRFWADQANMLAQIIVYVQANANAHVTSQQLGAVPSSTAHGTLIDAPPSPVDIPIL